MARPRWYGRVVETLDDFIDIVKLVFDPNNIHVPPPYLFYDVLFKNLKNKVSYSIDDNITEQQRSDARENLGVGFLVPDGLLTLGTLTFPTQTEVIASGYTYRLNGITLSTGSQMLTILPPDNTYTRIDVIAGDENGVIHYFSGTADINVPFPTIPQTMILLDTFLVNPDASIIVEPPTAPAESPFNQIYVTGPSGNQGTNVYAKIFELEPRPNQSYQFQITILTNSTDYNADFSRNGLLMANMYFRNSVELTSSNSDFLTIGNHIRPGDFIVTQDGNNLITVWSRRTAQSQRTYYKYLIHNANTPFSALLNLQNYESLDLEEYVSYFNFEMFTRIIVSDTAPADTSLLWYDTN